MSKDFSHISEVFPNQGVSMTSEQLFWSWVILGGDVSTGGDSHRIISVKTTLRVSCLPCAECFHSAAVSAATFGTVNHNDGRGISPRGADGKAARCT